MEAEKTDPLTMPGSLSQRPKKTVSGQYVLEKSRRERSWLDCGSWGYRSRSWLCFIFVVSFSPCKKITFPVKPYFLTPLQSGGAVLINKICRSDERQFQGWPYNSCGILSHLSSFCGEFGCGVLMMVVFKNGRKKNGRNLHSRVKRTSPGLQDEGEINLDCVKLLRLWGCLL